MVPKGRTLCSSQVDQRDRQSASRFRAELEAVSAAHRDAWLDRVLGLEEIPPDDAAALPRGCVPYLPAPIDKLLHVADHARVQPSDVFVDLGSGAGRAAIAIHLVTGAATIGIEIQPALVRTSRELATRFGSERVVFVEGDAAVATAAIASGSVFFLYCPFGGQRLTKLLAALEAIAQARPIRVCCLDLPLPEHAWLALTAQPSAGLDIYRSVIA